MSLLNELAVQTKQVTDNLSFRTVLLETSAPNGILKKIKNN